MKVAVLSFAHLHATSYVAALQRLPGVDVVAADPDHVERPGEPGGPELAATLGVDYRPDYASLLDTEPDVALVCAENTRHRSLVEQAAAAGAHVLCEKPLATSVEDAEAMVQACSRAGVSLAVAHPVRFHPGFEALARMVTDGRLGELVAITGTNNGRLPTDQRRWFVDPALAGGGAVTDHSVHLLDLLDALTGGEPVRRVHAVANRLLHPELEVETAGFVSLQTASGLSVALDCSWSRPAGSPTWGGLTLRVIGTEGICDVDAFAGRVAGETVDRGSLWLPYGPDLDALMISAFLDAVRDSRPVASDGWSGIRTVRIVEAAYASIASGAPVTAAEPGPPGPAVSRR